MISKREQDIEYTDLIEYEIYLEHDYLIKRLVKYVNSKLTDQLKKKLDIIETMGLFRSYATLTPHL